MKRLLLLVVSGCALTFSQFAFADAKADKEYVDNIKKEMLASCAQDKASEAACKCTVNAITTKLSAKELRALEENKLTQEQTDALEKKLMDALASCMPK